MKAFLLALVLGLGLGGTAHAEQIALPATAKALPADAPTIKLVDAGKGAKKPLRFTAKPGMKRSLVTTMSMGMAMQMGGNAAPMQRIPPIQMVVDIKVTDVAANGDIRYEFVLQQPKVLAAKNTPPMVVDAMKEASKGMAGLTGYAVVTNRGFTREADIAVPATANQQTRQLVDSLKQSMTQIAAPVPEEAVGVGATWETSTKITQNGLSIVQSAMNKLTSLKGNKATLAITLTQNATPQKITTGGMTVDLESYAATGSGNTQLDLAALVPTSAKMKMNSDMKMSSGGQKIGMKLDLEMTMKGK